MCSSLIVDYVKLKIDDDSLNLSDHLPVVVTFSANVFGNFSVLGSLGQNRNTNQNRCNKDYSYFRWDHGDKLLNWQIIVLCHRLHCVVKHLQ